MVFVVVTNHARRLLTKGLTPGPKETPAPLPCLHPHTLANPRRFSLLNGNWVLFNDGNGDVYECPRLLHKTSNAVQSSALSLSLWHCVVVDSSDSLRSSKLTTMAKNNNIIQIDIIDEEARPLTHPSRISTSTEPSTTKQKKTGRNNKLLHLLVGITIFGAVIVFVPSWSIIIRPPDGENGSSSRINKLRASSQDAAYSITKGGRQQDDNDGLLAAQIPKCAEHTFLTLYERQPQQQPRGDDVVEEKTTTTNNSF
eukprot:scaffold469_cov78-Skeletonema_marinoi.AAC.1